MSFLDFLQSVASGQRQTNPLAQRVAQQAVATAQGHLSASQDPNAPVGPSMIPGLQGLGSGVNINSPVANVPLLGGVTQGLMRASVLPLQLTGLGQEAFGNVAKATAGAGTAALGGLNAAMQGPGGSLVSALAQTNPATAALANALTLTDRIGPHLGQANPLPALAAASQAASNGGNPWERALAAQEASHAASPAQATLGEMAVNPLNFVNPLGELGAGLGATRDAVDALGSYAAREPTALAQGSGKLLQMIAGAGHAANAPAEAAFGLAGRRGAFRFGFDPAPAAPTAAQAGQTFAQANAGNTALGATRGNVAYADLLAGLGEGGKPGLGPALPGLQDLALPPELGPPAVFRGNVRQPDLIPGLGIGGRPGLGPELPPIQDVALPPELGPAFPERGNVTGQIGPLLPPSQDVPLPPELGPALPTRGNVPAEQLIARIGRNGGKGIGPELPPELGPATPAVGASAGQLPLAETGAPPLPVAPEGGAPLDFTDRAGTIRAVANAPLDHLNLVLRDLHNAIYPGQSADFAIPALTGQPRAAFRTSFLTDRPSGNAAEPYLDYLLNRVQKDPKAAARLAEINPMLADDVSMVAQSDLPLTEHKRLVQSLFDVGTQTPAVPAPSLSVPLAQPTGTLDDVRALIQGESQRVGTQYPPLDAKFYADRANVDPAQVPAMLDQLVNEGTLGRLPDGSLAVKPGAGAAVPNVAIPKATPAAAPIEDWRATAGPDAQDLLTGIEDAVKRGNVDEANYLVATAADYGVPVSRAQQVLNDAADAGGKGAGVDAQRQAIEQSPYARVFQYFNRDGQLKRINPQTGARLTSKAHYGGDEIWNLPDSGYDEVAAAALSSPEFGNNQNFGQTSDEFWRNAQSAFRQYQGLKKPGVQFGGDLAAGGGGFGLVPMSTGRVVGGLGGTLVGGGLGFAAPAPDTETRMKRAATGALLGGTLGTGLGSTPQGEALAEEALAGNRAAWQSGSKQIMPTGVSNAVSSLRATQKTALMTIPRNIMDNTIKQALGGKSPVKYLGDLLAQSREWGATLPALRNAGDEQQRMHVMLTSLGPDFANRDPESMARLAVKQGMDYNLDPEDLGTAGAYPPVSAARGAVGALAQPTKLLATGFLTPAVGAAEGVTLAGRAALQNAVLTPADMIGRFAFSMPDYTRQLADAAPAFIKKVAASGQSTALLDQEGRFGASLIKDPTLRAEWEAIQQAAEDAGASVALDHMGDFGTHGAFRKITNNAAPGGVWNIGQSQLLARRAAEHPALATGAIRAAFDNYQRALAAGHPDEAGTATIDQDTPGLGLLARLTNGGAAGPLHIPLTYSGSPIGPEVFDVPRQLDPYLHPNQQLYDKIKTITGAAGLGTNPVLDMAAYRLGISDTPHAGASRWAPLGTYAEQAAHAAGIPLLGALAENPVADLLNPAAKPGDVQQQLRTNRYLDPAAITAGNEMIYEMRGTSSSDPKNVDLVAQLRDPNSDFYQAALARGLGARAGSALAGEVIPGHPQAQTATAYAAEAAKTALLNQGLPLTRAQVQEIAARPDGGVVLSQIRQAQIDAAKLQDPLLTLQDVSSPQDLGAKVFQQWQRENGGLAGFPIVYNILAQREQERLGLVPLGTAMAQQQAYDQLNAGQAYGRPQPYPGVQPLPFDPQPMYDLYRLFGGGR